MRHWYSFGQCSEILWFGDRYGLLAWGESRYDTYTKPIAVGRWGIYSRWVRRFFRVGYSLRVSPNVWVVYTMRKRYGKVVGGYGPIGGLAMYTFGTWHRDHLIYWHDCLDP